MKPFAPKVGRYGSANAEDHRSDVKIKEDIALDEDDIAFINSFKTQLNSDEVRRVLIPAFMKRYSGKLVNDPKAMIPPPGKKAGEVMEWETSGKTIPVQVNIPELRQRLEDLKEKGINFYYVITKDRTKEKLETN